MNKNYSNLASLVLFSIIFPFLLLTCLPPCNSVCNKTNSKTADFQGMFVFGSSIMDNGNNNFLNTVIKANYLPYGIDLPFGKNGLSRFTNGKNFADRVGDLVKLPLLPAFSDPRTRGVVTSHGVNHASAGSGILDVTGSNMGVTSLNQQIQNFVNVTFPNLQAQRPECSNIDLLHNHLFLFSIGSNDFSTNFFQGGSRNVSLEFFTTNLTSSLASQLTKLYNLGARKFSFLNIGPLGCTPMARASMPNKECNEALNYAAFLFNNQLVQMLDVIRAQMPGFQSVVVNFFQIAFEFIRNPSFGGFSDVKNSCCEVSIQNGGGLCKRDGNVCSNRSKYVYFDGLHPTETLYGIVATRAYSSNTTTEVYPFNIQTLAQL